MPSDVIRGVEKTLPPPLVFISHDSSDAEIANSFETLLRRVSAGALRSFSSSDRSGRTGIRYGDEWYRQLMEKLAASSDVVCLFTRESLNRPWILFEAGVAKGNANKPVHGVALGIGLEEMAVGPFLQFQNCQDDETGLVGLMMQILQRVPNSDPDPAGLISHVNDFRQEVSKFLGERQSSTETEPHNQSIGADISNATLFEEIKEMVRDIPASIERNIIERPGRYAYARWKGSGMSPREDLEMAVSHLSGYGQYNPFIGLLILVSTVRDSIPWMYEFGRDVYRFWRMGERGLAYESLSCIYRALQPRTYIALLDDFQPHSEKGRTRYREFEDLLWILVSQCQEKLIEVPDQDIEPSASD